MHELKRSLEKELKEMETKAKNGTRFGMQELDRIQKLTDIVKNINKNEMYDQFSEEGEFSFDDGMSYARGRRNAKRDSMGGIAEKVLTTMGIPRKVLTVLLMMATPTAILTVKGKPE